MMRILYLAFIRLPTEKAHGAQIMKTCEALSKEGADIELIVPGRKTHIKGDLFEYYGVEKNFAVSKVNLPDFVKWGSIGFGFSALCFSELVKWKKEFWRADIIYSRDAFVLLQYFLLGRKLVYEAHTKPTLISTFVAKRAYRLVVISEGLRDVYIEAGVKPDKISIAHDAVDVEDFSKDYDKKESRERLGIPQNKKIAMYVGRIDQVKGADTFAASSEFVSDDTVCVLIGSGSIKNSLEKKYPKALFLPETPYKDLPQVLAAADVLVLPNSVIDENTAQYTSPLKAFAYLASKKPIVASDVPALKNIFKDGVVFFEPGNVSMLSEKIQGDFSNISTSDVERYSWGNRARVILRNLS